MRNLVSCCDGRHNRCIENGRERGPLVDLYSIEGDTGNGRFHFKDSRMKIFRYIRVSS